MIACTPLKVLQKVDSVFQIFKKYRQVDCPRQMGKWSGILYVLHMEFDKYCTWNFISIVHGIQYVLYMEFYKHHTLRILVSYDINSLHGPAEKKR